jgi:hypothetical protein
VGAGGVFVCTSVLVVIIGLRSKGRDGKEVAVEFAIKGWAKVAGIPVTGTTGDKHAK